MSFIELISEIQINIIIKIYTFYRNYLNKHTLCMLFGENLNNTTFSLNPIN